MASRRQVRYSPLPADEDHGLHDPRFDYTPGAFDRIPWKSIALAVFLLCLGSILLFLGFFILTGHMGGEKSQGYGLLSLGVLTFLPVNILFPASSGSRVTFFQWIKLPKDPWLRTLVPTGLFFNHGFYETRIAYYSWRGAKGYRFGSIPAY